MLPVPVFVPVPLWVNPPVYVAAPPENVIFNNIHDTTIINNNTNVINPGAAGVGAAGVAAGVAVGAAAGAIAAKVALPPSLAQKAAISGGQGAPGAPAGQPGAVPPATRLPAAQTLPGTSSVWRAVTGAWCKARNATCRPTGRRTIRPLTGRP